MAKDLTGSTFDPSEERALYAKLEAFHGNDSLRFERGLGNHNACVDLEKPDEQIQDEIGKHFVLAALAGKDDDESFAIAGEYGLGDGPGGFDLIRMENNADEMLGKGGDIRKVASEHGLLGGGDFIRHSDWRSRRESDRRWW